MSYSPEINATGSSMLNTWTSALGVQGTPLAQTIAQNTQSDFQMPDVRCADDDIAMHVPQDICIKIWKNEYINLASLLKKNQKRRGEESGTLQRRYNAVAYNAETVITRLGLGSRFFPHQFESVALFPRNAAV